MTKLIVVTVALILSAGVHFVVKEKRRSAACVELSQAMYQKRMSIMAAAIDDCEDAGCVLGLQELSNRLNFFDRQVLQAEGCLR